MANAQCCANAPTLSSTCGGGLVEDFGGLKTYITGSSNSKNAILLVSDVFGYEAPNLRKLADKAAAAGYLVVVPDFLHGDPLVPNNPHRSFQAWANDHQAVKVAEEAIPVIEALKNKGVSKIGAAGFCWGAQVIVELAKHPFIDAAVLLHPSFVTLDGILGVKVPISILGAEIDQISPPELLKQFSDALEAKKEIDHFLKIFPGVTHGWTVKYKSDDPEAVKCAEEAHKDMMDWFAKYIC
uniref:Endoglucanase 8 n=1 Tax=Actinidia deliciosa TaxID=3627 RepID=A0A3G3C2T3_ACTDE|nr:endoglucanase 8 [Actinidia deliciosa]